MYLQVFFAVLIGAINLGQAAPNLEAFSVGKSAAALVYQIIERVSRPTHCHDVSLKVFNLCSYHSLLQKFCFEIENCNFLLPVQESKIDPFSKEGHVLDHVVGDIELHDCDFSYPSRDDQLVGLHTTLVVYIAESYDTHSFCQYLLW